MKRANILITITFILYLTIPLIRVKGSELPISQSTYLYHAPTPTTTNSVNYSIHLLNKGAKISWEFRTYDNPFSVSFYCDNQSYSSGADYGSGTIEIHEHTYLLILTFTNTDDSNSGWIDVELKKAIDLIYGYNLCFIISLIGVVVIITIIKKSEKFKKNKS
jgi:hypothetical protein